MDMDVSLYTNYSFITIFTAAGGDINTKERIILTSLLEDGNTAVASAFLTMIKDQHDMISRAAINGYTTVVRFMAKKYDVNTPNRFGWTLLMEAAVHNRVEVVKILLDAGADTSIQLPNGSTARSLAINASASEIADLLE